MPGPLRLAGPTATLLEWDDHIPSFDEVHKEALEGQAIYARQFGGGLMSSRAVNPDRMNLDQIQRAVFDVVRQPLTEDERMREQTLDGRSTKAIAEEIVKPNDRLTSVERLEIYNRVYWFRHSLFAGR